MTKTLLIWRRGDTWIATRQVANHSDILLHSASVAKTEHDSFHDVIQYIHAHSRAYGFEPGYFTTYYVNAEDSYNREVLNVFDETELTLFYLSLPNG